MEEQIDYIKIPTDFFEYWSMDEWKKPDKRSVAFLKLILLAYQKDCDFVRYSLPTKKGEIRLPKSNLQNLFYWRTQKLNRFLDSMKKSGFIDYSKPKKYDRWGYYLIKIINFEKYMV